MSTPRRLAFLIFAALLLGSCSDPAGPRLPESEDNKEDPQEEPGITFVLPSAPVDLA